MLFQTSRAGAGDLTHPHIDTSTLVLSLKSFGVAGASLLVPRACQGQMAQGPLVHHGQPALSHLPPLEVPSPGRNV